MTILGISLGTTTSSVAILEDNRLVHFRTHSFRDLWSNHKAEHITKRMSDYLTHHRIQVVVIKLPPVSHQPCSIQLLINHMKTLCDRHGCTVKVITRKDIKHMFPELGNNRKLMRFVAEKYPMVTPEYERALKRKNNYHKKLFEAIAAAHLVTVKGG